MTSPLLRIFSAFVFLAATACAGDPQVNTFSIVAFDAKTGELGVAVQSKYFGVGSVVPWAQAGVGAVATQSSAKMSFGPDGLGLMQSGKSPRDALTELLATDERREFRQVGVVDAQGRAAAHTGKECLSWAGHREGDGYTVQGNLLAGEEVVKAMADAFEKSRAAGGELADWLMAALRAGQEAGGDRRGQQSAALLVVRKGGGPGGDNDRYIDLRVEDHAEPITELSRLLELHKKFYVRMHAHR